MSPTILFSLMSIFQSAETLPPPLLPVAPLIADLGGPYQRRVAATKTLQAMGEDARSHLEKAAAGDDLEISRRCQSLLHSLNQDRRRRAMAWVDRAFPHTPYVDMFWFRDGCFDTSSEAYKRLWPYFEAADLADDRMGKGWGKWRQATRLALYDMVEGGMPPWAVREMVEMMFANEAAYFEKR